MIRIHEPLSSVRRAAALANSSRDEFAARDLNILKI
jgi:hypothetical protein